MKITIDTKEDSAEDIRKIIAMLTKFCDGHSEQPSGSVMGNIFGDDSASEEQPSEPAPNAFANIFGDDSAKSEPEPTEEPEEKPNVFSLFQDDKPSEDQPIPDTPPSFGSSESQEDEVTDDEKRAARLMVEY